MSEGGSASDHRGMHQASSWNNRGQNR